MGMGSVVSCCFVFLTACLELSEDFEERLVVGLFPLLSADLRVELHQARLEQDVHRTALDVLQLHVAAAAGGGSNQTGGSERARGRGAGG